MNFEKYSKAHFERLGLDTPEARQLAAELQQDVNEEIHAAVLPAVLNVVERLNAQGHNLAVCDDIRAGDISFRDEPIAGECHLRLAFDVLISAGYANTMTGNEIETKLSNGSA